MATPIGRILLMPKGEFNAATIYNALDWVRNGGAAWVCKVDNTVGIAPPTLPTTSNANWTLLSEDGTVGGWSSISNKPFETIGAGLNVNLLQELEVAAKNTYIPTGTSSDRPISGQGVKAALDTIQDGTTIDSFADVETAIAGKADKTEIVHWVDATLPSGSLSYNVSNSLFKTTSKIVGVLADGGGNYSSISIPSTGVFTITFPAALASSLSISIGISNATSESGTVS